MLSSTALNKRTTHRSSNKTLPHQDSNELPQATPMTVNDEHQLIRELENIACFLHPDKEWEERVAALLRLEGLALGGASDVAPGFADLLGSLIKEPLTTAMIERRSSVSRQACHTVEVLIEECGLLLVEPAVSSFFPATFKARAMGISVVTEAASKASRSIIRHCPSQRLLPNLCDIASTNRNGKLRHAAAELLAEALAVWHVHTFDRFLDTVGLTVLAVAQDAQSETRLVGRSAFAAIYAKNPVFAELLLRQVPDTEKNVRDRLWTAALNAEHSLSRTDSIDSSISDKSASSSAQGVVPRLPLPNTCGQQTIQSLRLPSAGRILQGTTQSFGLPFKKTGPTPIDSANPVATTRRRKSLGGAALRVAVASKSRQYAEQEMTSTPGRMYTFRGAGRVLAFAETTQSPSQGAHSLNSNRGSVPCPATSSRGPSVSQLLSSLENVGAGQWNEKSDLFDSLSSMLESEYHQDGITIHTERIVAVLVQGAGESHSRIAMAALTAAQSALTCCCTLFEAHLDKFMPVLFVRMIDPKEAIKTLACAILDTLPVHHSIDSTVSAVGKSLSATKSYKVKCAVMRYITSIASLHGVAYSLAIRSVVEELEDLTAHKAPEVRRAALRAMDALNETSFSTEDHESTDEQKSRDYVELEDSPYSTSDDDEEEEEEETEVHVQQTREGEGKEEEQSHHFDEQQYEENKAEVFSFPIMLSDSTSEEEACSITPLLSKEEGDSVHIPPTVRIPVAVSTPSIALTPDPPSPFVLNLTPVGGAQKTPLMFNPSIAKYAAEAMIPPTVRALYRPPSPEVKEEEEQQMRDEVLPLLRCASKFEKDEVVKAAEIALMQMAMSSSQCLVVLAKQLPTHHTSELSGFDDGSADEVSSILKTIVSVLYAAASKGIPVMKEAHCTMMVQGLIACYASTEPEVRKGAVDTLVEIWKVKGDGYMKPMLEHMPPTLGKLVALFYKKTSSW